MPIIKDLHIGWDTLDLDTMTKEEAQELVGQICDKLPMNTLAQILRDTYDDGDREYMIHRMTMPDEELSKEREREEREPSPTTSRYRG